MPIVQELSNHTRPLFEAVNEGYKPFEYVGLTEGMTHYNSNYEGAFSLNAPIAGMARDLTSEPGIDIQPEGDRFILRTIIGYAMAVQGVERSNIFTLQIASLINSMVGAAYKVHGSRIIRLTFDRPNDPGVYFREMENSAGYEIRLFGELNPIVNFEMELVE